MTSPGTHALDAPPDTQPSLKRDAPAPKRRRLLRRLGRKLALVLMGVALSWLLLEVLLRVTFDSLPAGIQGVIQHVRRAPWSEDTLIPVFPYIIDRDFQARLPVGLKNYAVHWSDAKFTFDTIAIWDGHRAGLRTDPPRWPLDIQVYGDSFAMCWTEKADCWVQRLADDGWHVVNAANPGTGPGGQLNLMREIADPTKPALIIWQWFTNDVTDDYDLARIRDEVDELPGGPLPDPVRLPRGLAQYSAVLALLDNWLDPPNRTSPYRHYQDVSVSGRRMSIHTDEYPHLHSMAYANNEYGLAKNLEHQAEGEALAEEIGAQMLIVFIPSKEEAYADLLGEYLKPEYIEQIGQARRTLIQQCEDQGWRCLDPLPTFRQAIRNGETVYYAFDAHLDPSGNRILADLVRSYILDHALIPARLSGQ